MIADSSQDGYIGLFFVAEGTLLLHTCSLADAESYGDFLNYPESHDDVWQHEYARKYQVDFDYFPRGRIVYNQAEDIFLLYHDKCVTVEAENLCGRYPKGKCVIALDEHYQCHKCNMNYVV